MFPRIYENQTCPLQGYEAYTLRILANPTGAEKEAWYTSFAGLAAQDYAAFGAAAVPILGETRADGLNFSTADAGAATISDAGIPDELLEWVFVAPGALWQERADNLKKKLLKS